MKAFVCTRYGSAEVLELTDLPTPTPKDDEVLIRIHAVSINDWDWQAMQGIPFVNRLMFGMFRPTKHPILGTDVAGRVEAVGENVRRFQAGDEVFGDLSGTWGGFAEYVCAKEMALALKSPRMTFEQAAAIPQAGMLAVQALHDVGRLQPGQSLLINGAGGGVGTFAIQLARLHGTEVTAVDHGSKLEMLRVLGAAHVVDYTREDCTRLGRKYDLILDVRTTRSLFDWARTLNRGGTYVTVGGDMIRLAQVPFVMPFRRIRMVMLKANKDLELMKVLFDAGSVVPVIDGSWRFHELPDAMRYYGSGLHRGKVVVAL